MSINIIFAITKDYYFSSKDNDLPWKEVLKEKYNIDRIVEDQMFFKDITVSKNNNENVLIMGRNTYMSIGKPLPNRINIVISNKLKHFTNTNYTNLYFVSNIKEAIVKGKELSKGNIFIIGGADIIKDSIIHNEEYNIDNIYVTEVDGIEIKEGNKLFYKIPDNFIKQNVSKIKSKYYLLEFIKYVKNKI